MVVTHNRRALLAECLAALSTQTRPLDRLLVVDNASSDGTSAMVRARHPDVDLLELPRNVGSSGGFHEGLKAAHVGVAEWIWLMDDDTIPAVDALEQLLVAPLALDGLPPPLLLSSRALWTDGTLHPMNIPGLERRRPELVIRAAERGLMPVRATTFVSLLVHRDAVERHGLPLAHFFIWSDDIEYTGRILRDGTGYLVPGSVVCHKTRTAHTALSDSGGRFYFHVRNTLYMIRGRSWDAREKLTLGWILLTSSVAYLRRNSLSPASVLTVLRGMRDGLRPVPHRSLRRYAAHHVRDGVRGGRDPQPPDSAARVPDSPGGPNPST